MAQSERSSYWARALGIGAALILTGCFATTKKTESPTVQTKSKTELAVEAIDSALLIKCQGLTPNAPENEVGALLDDGTEAMLRLAECMTRQGKLIDYLAPVVKDEKARKL